MEKGSCTVSVWSRVTGFFRPVQVWNEGKKEEFENRKTYKLEEGNEKTVSCFDGTVSSK